MNSPIISLQKKTKGNYILSGQLVFATLPQLLGNNKVSFDDEPHNREISVDCSAVSHLDSAGIALLLEWKKDVLSHKKNIHFIKLPKQAKAIIQAAHLSNLLIIN